MLKCNGKEYEVRFTADGIEKMEVELGCSIIKFLSGTEEEISELNDVLKRIDQIRSEDPSNFPLILRRIGATVPEGTILEEVIYRNKTIVLEGHADLREQYVKMESNLKSEDTFKGVKSSTSDFVSSTNIDFSFELTL